MALYLGFDDIWWGSPPFGSMESCLMASPASLLTETKTGRNKEQTTTLLRSSPLYEITEDDDQYQIAMDVPGVKAEDIKVELENGHKVLRVSGCRKIKLKDDEEAKEARFEKTFKVGEGVVANNITANCADGVLIVTAPKDKKCAEVHKVKVTSKPHSSNKKRKGSSRLPKPRSSGNIKRIQPSRKGTHKPSS